jgi:peptidoglycan hydrolase-like protein with peptidoglycan-binding domain
MKPNESFVGQPVRSLQTMLRVIAENDDLQPSVIPDGIYGPQTVSAVSSFQRRNGLPITGVADEQTWYQIVLAYEPALIAVGPVQPLEIILEPNQVIRQGDENPNLYLVQAMLTVLAQAYGSITAPAVTGVLDIPTANAISEFQVLTLLPATGELDRETWKNLAIHYPMATIRKAQENI